MKLPKKSSRKHLDVVQEYTNFQINDPGLSLGKTDIGLIKDIFEFNQLKFDFQDLKKCVNLLNLKSSSENYNSTRGVNPGVEKALEYCIEVGAINSVLTGNSKSRAIDKLRSTNLIANFSIELGFFGDHDLSREELVKSLKNFAEKSNWQKIVLIGDTLLDVRAAKKNSLKIIAVASGNVSYLKLKVSNPNFVIRNFTKDISYFEKIIIELL
jgi:phosphoglycolate phosphatase-like HAD superfamily hydrolase